MQINYKRLIIIMAIIGVFLRLIYVCYTPINERQHDEGGGCGHLDYINILYMTDKLPDNNDWQFYHPPLHHFIASRWLKLADVFGMDYNEAMEQVQLLTCSYSCLIILITYFILKELEIDDKIKLLIMSIISMHPSFIILAGSVNNDMLMTMFIFLDMFFMIKWYKNPKIKNTLLLALSVALGAITKISSTTIAVPIIYIFLVRFIKDIKDSSEKKKVFLTYLARFSLFGLVSLGIGLSYSIRNLIKFDQSLFYVPYAGDHTFIGNGSVFERITLFSKEWDYIFCRPFDDINVISFLIKSSLFGEYYLPEDKVSNVCVETALLVVNIALIIISMIGLIAIIYDKIKKIKQHEKNDDKSIIMNMFIIYYFTTMILYFIAVFQMGTRCSMDFRYIVPTIFLGLMFIGNNSLIKHKKIYISVLFLAELFAILSIIFVLTHMKFLIL